MAVRRVRAFAKINLSLRSLGVPTELIIYPGEFHAIKRPSFVKDRLERYLAWYDRFLRDTGTASATLAPGAVH